MGRKKSFGKRKALSKSLTRMRGEFKDIENIEKDYFRKGKRLEEESQQRLRATKMLFDLSKMAEDVTAVSKKEKQEQEYVEKHGLTEVSTPGLWGTGIGSESYYVGEGTTGEGEDIETYKFKLDPGQISAYTTQARLDPSKDPMETYTQHLKFDPTEEKVSEYERAQMGISPSRPEIPIGLEEEEFDEDIQFDELEYDDYPDWPDQEQFKGDPSKFLNLRDKKNIEIRSKLEIPMLPEEQSWGPKDIMKFMEANPGEIDRFASWEYDADGTLVGYRRKSGELITPKFPPKRR